MFASFLKFCYCSFFIYKNLMMQSKCNLNVMAGGGGAKTNTWMTKICTFKDAKYFYTENADAT